MKKYVLNGENSKQKEGRKKGKKGRKEGKERER